METRLRMPSSFTDGLGGGIRRHEAAVITFPSGGVLIQCALDPTTGWTLALKLVTIRGMPSGFHIDKLSDEFGQYTLVLKCSACGHERKAEPHTLGRLCGWDARLQDVAKRMRCSKCSKKCCVLRAFPPKKPRGYTALGK
jgi:hypothetical protein